MGKHSKQHNNRHLTAAFGLALVSGASAAALFAGHGTASADTTDDGTVFGQDASSVMQSSSADWNNMIRTQDAALKIQFNANAYDDYVSQFDKCQSNSVAQEAACVNSIVNTGPNRIQPTTWNLGPQAPVETIVTHTGDSTSVVTLEADILEHRLGVPSDQLLVTNVLDHGNPNHPYAVLLVQAPGAAPGPASIAMSNFPTAPQASKVGENWIATHGSTAQFTPVKAMKPYWTLKSGPGV